MLIKLRFCVYTRIGTIRRYLFTKYHIIGINSCNDVFSMFSGLMIVYALLPTDF